MHRETLARCGFGVAVIVLLVAANLKVDRTDERIRALAEHALAAQPNHGVSVFRWQDVERKVDCEFSVPRLPGETDDALYAARAVRAWLEFKEGLQSAR